MRCCERAAQAAGSDWLRPFRKAGVETFSPRMPSMCRHPPETALQYYKTVDHAVELFLTYFGPAIRASEKGGEASLRDDLTAVFNRHNRATDDTAVIENTYLLTVAIRA